MGNFHDKDETYFWKASVIGTTFAPLYSTTWEVWLHCLLFLQPLALLK